jgi:ureidoacrylate peracid hydrolase
VKANQACVPAIRAAVDKARQIGMKVVWVRTEHAPWTDTAPWVGRIRKLQDIRKNPICVKGTWGAEFYEVEPKANEPVVTKHRYNAFLNTDLDMILQAMRIRTAAVIGVTTNVCVESTARECCMRNYYGVMLSDCCAADTVAEHEATLHTFDTYFGIVATSAEMFKAATEAHAQAA